ncbi:MAG: hypothetical protein AAF921_09925 [Cyanobacteria bacterium P01_D01_bin.44]
MRQLFVDKNDRDLKILMWILLLGLGLRIAVIPLSMTTEGDAAVRVGLAAEWLENPTLILHGVWLPLQTYYTAAAIWLTQEWVLTPIYLNIFFSVVTAIPLYYFTKHEFGTSIAGFASAAFLLYPIAFRNSLMAMSDTPFAFFVALGMWGLAVARQQNSSVWYATVAGLSMLLASALRFEGWILIPLMAVVLWRRPKQMLIFVGLAMLMPLAWIIGSGLINGDFLYSLKYQAEDTASTLTTRGGMTLLKRFARAIFIPGVLAFGMTLPLFGLSLWGAIASLTRRNRAAVWLVPFFGLFSLLCYKSVGGTMNLQPRYVLVLGMLLLPFAVVGLEAICSPRRRAWVGMATLLSMLPLSYAAHLTRPFLNRVLADTQMQKRETPASLLEAIPRLAPATQDVIRLVQPQLQPDDAMLVLNLPEIGYLIPYPMGLPASRLGIFPAGVSSPQGQSRVSAFLYSQSQGLLLAAQPTFSNDSDQLFRWQPTPELTVTVQPVQTVHDVVIYRYVVEK